MDQYGTTAIPVSPVPESEIETAKNIFQRMADSVIAAAGLRQELDQLRQDIASLRQEIEYVRTRNRELDEQVTEVRRQRDQAVQELSDLKAHTADTERTIASITGDNQSLNSLVERQRQEILDLKRARDDAAFAHMEAEDRLAKVMPLIESLSGLLPPKQVPTPTPTQVPGPADYWNEPKGSEGILR